jgi:hypothetical protein
MICALAQVVVVFICGISYTHTSIILVINVKVDKRVKSADNPLKKADKQTKSADKPRKNADN